MIKLSTQYDIAMRLQTEDEADSFLALLIAQHLSAAPERSREEAERIERDNLAYYAGYFDHETRARVERLFKCAHPIFGSIAEKGPPTAEEAFRLGKEMGERLRRERDR